jgi:L-amino acid N-acyltransferase YncA
MDVIIREARTDDAAAILDVLNPIIESDAVAFDAPLTEADERGYIASFPSRGVFHVALRCGDGRLVGFQSMEPFATYTSLFDHVGVLGTYVDAACRRQQVARRLFAATFATARARGFEKLFTYIREDNPAALAAYAGQGFRVVGRAERHLRVHGLYVAEIIVERFL